MSAVAAPAPLYHSPRGLFPHQVDGIVRVVSNQGLLVVWDTGTGKSHLAMASGSLLFEDADLDLVLIVCEQEKIAEWVEDFKTFTDLSVAKYHKMSPAKREKLRGELPQVLVSTYETVRNDCAYMAKVPVGKKTVSRWVPGPLTETLMGKRVLVVYDEITKIGASRTTALYKAHEVLVNALRDKLRVIGLSATPLERSPENFFNLGRILFPDRMPTVKRFEDHYVKTVDIYGTFVAFKNLTAEECAPGVTSFRDLFGGVILRKSKTDPDIKGYFPAVMEEFSYIDLDDRHLDFYRTVKDVFADADEWVQRSLFTTMRQIAGHPMALLSSQSAVAQTIVREVGENGLRAMGAAKCDRLVQRLVPIVKGQGAQAIVFTFFGPSMGPWIQAALEAAHITVAPFYGPSSKAKDEAKAAFRRGEFEVLLSSDAGSKGLNIPEASYVENYELPLTHANYVQRYSRAVRLGDPGQPPVTVHSMIAVDTAEDGIEKLGWKRAEWTDKLLPDDEAGEDFLTAAQRKAIMQMTRKRS